jgi:transcriptional regulator with XRE-family HTH domain
MTKRKYMIEWREKRHVTLEIMAKAAQCSEYLLEQIELDDQFVTHPNIAQRIAKAYKLTKTQYYSMIPENYRPGPNYDPDRYVEEERDFGVFNIRSKKKIKGVIG